MLKYIKANVSAIGVRGKEAPVVVLLDSGFLEKKTRL